MQKQETALIEDFLNKLSYAPMSILMLDYDGTLAPFRVERDRAYPYPGVLSLLEKIKLSQRTRIILITGRPIQEVQTLLSPLTGIEMWGAHGLDHLQPDGTRERVTIEPRLVAILHQAETWLQTNGMANLMEVKPGGVAVHWRGLPEDRVAKIRRETLAGWNIFTKHEGLKFLSFEGGLELRITRPDKGDAIASILKQLDPAIPVAFLGDDLTDEDGFRKLTHRGLAILVREEYRETEARAWLKPPQELLGFLEQWANRVSI